jgi:hypothetical protein
MHAEAERDFFTGKKVADGVDLDLPRLLLDRLQSAIGSGMHSPIMSQKSTA